jgi:trimethylamine--corrinoid protein Co-methyltransferase
LLANINTNSPLRYGESMADGLIAMAEMGQPVVISVITMSGATSPITIAGALVQQNAEALAGVTLTQMVRRGAPVFYGSFTSNVSMRSGSFVLGTPEFVQVGVVSGQLARRYGLPFKFNNACTSNAVDAQSAYESQMSLWACMLGQPNFLAHGVGWLENGLTCSFEKMIVDCEMLQMISRVLEPLEVNQETLAVDDIRNIGPGGHYLGSELTMKRYGTAFYEPILTSWETYEDWQKAGATDLVTRADNIVRQLLEEYEEPVLEQSRREELDAYVARRREKITKGGD